MFLQERQAEIVETINNHGSAKVVDLATHFNVTEDCIRKDLQQLDKRGLVCRVYGGAVSVNGQTERQITKRYGKNRESKEAIAHKAYELIEQNDTIFLDVSSTNVVLAELLANTEKHLVVYSNMLKILEICSGNKNLKTIGLGGTVNPDFDCFLGTFTLTTLKSLHFDKAFMGVLGLNTDTGTLFTYDLDDALIKHEVIKNAHRSYLMCSSDKVGQVGSCEFAKINEIDTIICDKANSKLEATAEKQGVNCI